MTAKRSKKPKLFARVNPNFTSGRYKPPSKNIADQSRLFRSDDPYAGQSRVAQMTRQVADQYQRSAQPMGGGQMYGQRSAQPMGGGQVYGPSPQTGVVPNPTLAGAYGGFGQGSTIGDIGATLKPGGAFDTAYQQFGQGQGSIGDLMKAAGYQVPGAGGGGVTPSAVPGGAPTPGAGLQGLQSFIGMSPEDLAAMREIYASGPMNTQNAPLANAARLQAQAMRGNPFISREGLLQMARGFTPNENQIDPAYYQYTSPVIQQALQGLRTSAGYRPEDQMFTQQQFTPMGLR